MEEKRKKKKLGMMEGFKSIFFKENKKIYAINKESFNKRQTTIKKNRNKVSLQINITIVTTTNTKNK